LLLRDFLRDFICKGRRERRIDEGKEQTSRDGRREERA
jgi:hypothetical protein